MTGLSGIVVAVLCAVVLAAPRRYAVLALIASVLFLSYQGGAEIGGIRMHAGRFLAVAGIARVVFRRELAAIQFGALDKAVLGTYAFVTAMFLMRTWAGYGTSSSIALITPMAKVGEFVDVTLVYFTFRALVQGLDDVRWALIRTVPLLGLLVMSLFVERMTFSNPLAALGAIPSVWVDDVDGGRIRCFGASAHPSLLGTIGAWMAVVYVALILSKEDRRRGLLGAALAVAVVLFANSGGPLTSFALGLVAWTLWCMRSYMRLVRWGILAGLGVLALVMKDPLWYLPSKFSLIFGGSGWHRSYLMHQTIMHIGEWWLAGMPLELTVPWFPYLVMGAADITNLYVAFAIDGGLGALLMLVWLIAVAFRQVGRWMQGAEQTSASLEDRFLVWGLGCGLLMHVVNYFGITYFDQSNTLWLFQLAAVAVIGTGVTQPNETTLASQGRRWAPAVRANYRTARSRYPMGRS